MKRRMLKSLFVLVILAIATVTIWIIKNTSSDKEDNANEIEMTAESEFRYYPENDYNYPVGEYLEWNSKERNEFVVNATVEKGNLVYMVYDMNGADYNQKEKYTLCEKHIIDSTGEYTFVPENLEDGKRYYFCLEPEDYQLDKQEKYVVAHGFFIRNRYSSK